MRFVARLMEGEKMAVLCREFDISRKTGYKLYNRYKDSGVEGLTDRSRRPYRHANRLPFQIENLILQLRRSWICMVIVVPALAHRDEGGQPMFRPCTAAPLTSRTKSPWMCAK
jgi:hypothetical protein